MRRCARGCFPNAAGVYTPVANLNPAMLPYLSFWPQANGAELLANGLPSGTAFSYNNPKPIHPRRLRHAARSTTRISDRDYAFGVLHHRRRQQPDPAGRSVVRLLQRAAHAGGQHAGNAHLLAQHAQHLPRRIFARRLQSRFVAAGAVSRPASSFVTGAGPGGIVVNGGVTTTGLSGITSAGPNNAAGVWNRRNLFTYTDDVQITQGHPPDQRRRLVPARAGQRGLRLAPARAGHLHQPDHLPARHRQQLPGGSHRQRTGLAKPVRRLVCRRRHQAAPQSDAPRGHPPRIHHRLERSLRQRRQLHHRCHRRAGDRSARRQFGLHAEQRHQAVQRPRRPGVGPVRQRQDRRPRRLRNLLFADRRSQFPAEFAAALQRLDHLFRLAVLHRARRSRRRRAAVVRPRRSHALHHLRSARRAGRTRRLPPSRNGTSPSSSSSPQPPCCASPTSDRSAITAC